MWTENIFTDGKRGRKVVFNKFCKELAHFQGTNSRTPRRQSMSANGEANIDRQPAPVPILCMLRLRRTGIKLAVIFTWCQRRTPTSPSLKTSFIWLHIPSIFAIVHAHLPVICHVAKIAFHAHVFLFCVSGATWCVYCSLLPITATSNTSGTSLP